MTKAENNTYPSAPPTHQTDLHSVIQMPPLPPLGMSLPCVPSLRSWQRSHILYKYNTSSVSK